jgi:hypothetical protein
MGCDELLDRFFDLVPDLTDLCQAILHAAELLGIRDGTIHD